MSNFVARPILLRFNYDFSTGSFYPQFNPGFGWALDNIAVTNIAQLVSFSTNATVSTNFTFVPSQATNYDLLTRALIYSEFPLDWGPIKPVTAVIGSPVILMAPPAIIGNQVQLNFSLASGLASSFHLLQSDQFGSSWSTNAAAVLTTNIPGSSYRFTTTTGCSHAILSHTNTLNRQKFMTCSEPKLFQTTTSQFGS